MHETSTGIDWTDRGLIAPEERQALVGLAAVPGIGSKTVEKLLWWRRFADSSLVDIWQADAKLWERCGLSSKQQAALRRFREERTLEEWWQQWEAQAHILTLADAEYPAQLRELHRPPVGVFVLKRSWQVEESEALESTAQQLLPDLDAYLGALPVAVVGTRSMTEYGRKVTEHLTRSLVMEGASSVVSGFMYGVDTAAHRAAVRFGARSVGVLGFGFDQLEKSVPHGWLEEFIDKGGVLISEYPPETPAIGGRFVARNRIVAALSQAVLVTEAPKRSGSHITARFGLEQGKVVGAVPGPITSQCSEGTTWLLQQGAVPVATGQDLLTEMVPLY
jgi:DNA processing protein